MAAFLIGGYFRFANLGRLEISPDEADSWHAAAAPSIAEVAVRQIPGTRNEAARIAAESRETALNLVSPRHGSLPIHELILHGWIAAFGSSLAAIRSLSAALGTLAILLLYACAEEMLAAGDGGYSPGEARLAAAAGALIFALSAVTIKYSREARMYPLTLAAELAQAALFLRALRRGGTINYIGLAILTLLAVSVNFSAVLLPASEALSLLYSSAPAKWRPPSPRFRRAVAVTISLLAPGLILAPVMYASLHASAAASTGGLIKWIKPPRFYAPIALFNKASGSVAFAVLAALAGWGAIAGWRRGARDGIVFALIWMWAPPVLMLIASYALTPIFVERYALSSFAPFFILCGVGIAAIPGFRWKAAALAAAVLVSLGHLYVYDRKPHDAQYREAFAAAEANIHSGETAVIVPGYAVEVLRYYMPSSRLESAVTHDSAHGVAILVLGDQNLSSQAAAEYHAEYPHVIVRLRGVTVLKK